MSGQITHPAKLKQAVNLLLLLMPLFWISSLPAAELYSAHVDRDAEKIIIKGSGFQQSTTVKLAGVAVNKGNVTNTQLEIPFATEIYSVVQLEANYNLVIDGSNSLSIYIDKPILAPPPLGGDDCPCTDAWNDNAYLSPDTLWCQSGFDGTQNYVYGLDQTGGDLFISAAFDPENIFFDSNNPGNSMSFCSLSKTGVAPLTLPVVNEQQYQNCFAWFNYQNGCVWPP